MAPLQGAGVRELFELGELARFCRNKRVLVSSVDEV